jgi:competence protein ComEA
MNLLSKISALVLGLGLACSAFAGPVNINEASAAVMTKTLHQISPALAQAIVAHRERRGPFHSPMHLAEVRGIDIAIIQKNRDLIVTGDLRKYLNQRAKTLATEIGN